jgi:hypothetical protein
MDNRLSLVDADGLIYLAGYAGEERSYDAVVENEDGDIRAMTFDSAAAIKEWLAANDDYELVDKELKIKALPVEYSLKVVKNKLTEIKSRYGANMRVYIKGNGVNFRDEVYQVQKYKGNRQTVKPIHYDAIIEYMMSKWDAERIDGKEVDDECALRARQASKPTVVCSPDKDLDQIPGLHWNYAKSVEYAVDPLEAEMFFWEQVLSGDSADNIMGIWKVGPGKAEKIVAAWYEEGLTQEQIWEQVIVAYTASQGMPSCPYSEADAEDIAIQTARAIWMQDTANMLWTPPGVPMERMEIEEDEWL